MHLYMHIQVCTAPRMYVQVCTVCMCRYVQYALHCVCTALRLHLYMYTHLYSTMLTVELCQNLCASRSLSVCVCVWWGGVQYSRVRHC